jgi:uncharacterized protein (TIGR02996 family)
MPPQGYEPFLRAICENPEDDTVRLAYADWLDENGDPERAEFIRVHVERGRANARGPKQDPRVGRAWDLRQKHEAGWRSELPKLQGVTWGRLLRGFIGEAVVDRDEVLLTRGNEIFTTTPIQYLHLRKCDDHTAAEALRLPVLSNLRGLRVAVDLLSAAWDALITSPCFTNLRHLIVEHPAPIILQADDAALRRLARSQGLPRLGLLHLGLDIGSEVRAELERRFRRVTAYGDDFEPL